MMKKNIRLMDVTIREGSAVIDYKFSASQIADIAEAIDTAGIPYMEVGNGGGLGVPDEYYRGSIPQSTDVEQVRAAKNKVQKCKIGLLANPEPYTKPKHIERVKGEIDFLRIAARIDDIFAAKTNVEKSKSLGIETFFQMMRSSKATRPEILKAAKEAQSLGADAVYVVDTIGWFLPSHVGAIIGELKSALKISVGFHAHNNLMMAVANSVAAIHAGADFVDASLIGFGRDAGNAQLEALVAILQREGIAKNIQLDILLKAAEKYIQPLSPTSQGVPPLQVAAGSSNVVLYPIDFYLEIAQTAGIDFLMFIKQLGNYPRSEPDVKRALKELGKDPEEIFKKLGLT